MSTGIAGTLVHSPRSTNEGYTYRTRMGMMPTAEFRVVHEDFDELFTTNAISGWSAIIDTGCTNVTNTTATTGAYGVMSMTSDTISEGSALYLPRSFQLISGKRFFMECRVQLNEVTDNAFQFGLSICNAVINPEDLWTTASTDLVTFGTLDGSATTKMLCDLNNSGSTAETGTLALSAATWHTLAIGYDGGTKITGYVDGQPSQTWAQAFATTVPLATAMGAFVGHLNGDGSGTDTAFVDYIRIVSER